MVGWWGKPIPLRWREERLFLGTANVERPFITRRSGT
jgi:hypothetical protein